MTESHDPWESAREQQREQVQAIFAKRAADPVTERRREFRLSRRNSGMVALAVLALLVAVGIAVPRLRTSAAEERAQERAHQAKVVAAERARVVEAQKPRFAAGPVRRPGEPVTRYRSRLMDAGAALITADARARMKAGTITGPVAGTECAPFPDTTVRQAQEPDPRIRANRYECIAYERHFPLSELEGKARTGVIGEPYWLVAHYATGRLAFCLLVPHAGEGGKALAFVRVKKPCADPLERG